ncbi:NosD domain-containing protein [Flexithrix dorotheae]|uniref:NosD domain-containing protein n=1 Tax=Flexithrix dorotheae TaxID=70993 RepID=UPI0003780481|nr:NosD domain-containing protein [Flexithrix dorotheae]
MKTIFILMLLSCFYYLKAENIKKEDYTLQAITNHGTFYYNINNSGKLDISSDLQQVFNEIADLEDVSATFIFSPGVYYFDSPIKVNLAGVKFIGHGHSGIDIHGANLATGTIFRFGKNCGPYCITFNYAGRTKSFPAEESPWHNKNLKVEIENIAFVGYNNTGVNTAAGYSRWRGDKPNFRGLNWYPEENRYKDVEKEGQRAIYLPPAPKREGSWWSKCELLRITGCYFTELYAGIDASWTDVSYIDKNWFGQLTYAIRLSGPGMMVNNNLFADLETALKIDNTNFSAFSNNTFAYVGKSFEFNEINHSTISGNALLNKKNNTGAAAAGGFIYVKQSNGLSVTNNSLNHMQDSRKKTISVDKEPNGQNYIQFENSTQLNFSQNVIQTLLTQTVVRLHNCTNSIITNNIITFGEGGNAVAETGECKDNYYKKIRLENSDTFDNYKY